VVRLLDQGRHYAEISRETGASTATITRIAGWLNHGAGGYQAALRRRPTAKLREGERPAAAGHRA
jgi:TrpR-related protein YerC/YecD